MSDPIPHSDDPRIQAKIDKAMHHNSLVDQVLRWLLHYIERLIAVMTILALLGALGMEVYHMATAGAAYFADVETPGMWCSATTTPGATWPALPVSPGFLPSAGSWSAEAN